ncbi:hypothetical protein [Longimicrobium sp.]|uniref:hypothetical protein n=1 Tax=Longimicrobium sp. TaxID=2029185 RepID=UPI002E367F6B|nr:hypothetical protein [Longimicrobium sp.]HEX6040625.1 hypothetical protein [Longimicrobium sp.]
MKKLVLDLDSLAVESFEADAVTAGQRGTVEARSTDGVGCPKSYPYYCGPQRPTVGCALV